MIIKSLLTDEYDHEGWYGCVQHEDMMQWQVHKHTAMISTSIKFLFPLEWQSDSSSAGADEQLIAVSDGTHDKHISEDNIILLLFNYRHAAFQPTAQSLQ